MELRAPVDVYLDTDVVVNCLIEDLRHSQACLQAMEHLGYSGSTVWISQLLRVEYLQAVRSIATQGRAPSQLSKTFDLDNWVDSRVREAWLRHCWELLDEYIGILPSVVELPITRNEIDRAPYLMARFALRSQDALHLATALHYDIPVFWTCDDHFQRVDDLSVEVIRNPA